MSVRVFQDGEKNKDCFPPSLPTPWTPSCTALCSVRGASLGLAANLELELFVLLWQRWGKMCPLPFTLLKYLVSGEKEGVFFFTSQYISCQL